MTGWHFRKKTWSKNKQQNNNFEWQLVALNFFILAVVLVVFVKLYELQVVHNKTYELLASDQHEVLKNIIPQRGQIFINDRDAQGHEIVFPLATNKEFFTIYAQPNLVTDSVATADQIYPLLFPAAEIVDLKKADVINDYRENENYQKLLKSLEKKNDPYEPLKNRVESAVWEKIKSLNLLGIKSSKEWERYYPDTNIGSHILGFVRHDGDKDIGQYGLEGYFADILGGTRGYLQTESGAKGITLAFGNVNFVPAKNGSDIFLTIDRTIEIKACTELKNAFEKYKFEDGTIIVLQPQTGAVLALCSYPDFDPNNYNKVENIKAFNNTAISQAYEVGSIFKPITMATALDLDKISPETKYFDEGFVKVDRFSIKNFDGKAHGWKTMTQVLEDSLNTGAIFAAKQAGNENFRNYVNAFNFGRKTGIELSGEAAGNIKSLESLNDVYTFTASFGQGITATPLQMAAAYSAIANNGVLLKTSIINKIDNKDGKEVKTESQVIRQVISPRTSYLLKNMLVSVVDRGYDKKATVKGYRLAGKTGTAQMADSQTGKYAEDKFTHSFVGFGPADDPKFTILIKFANPQDVRFASESTAPVFQHLAEFILKYYEIPPNL